MNLTTYFPIKIYAFDMFGKLIIKDTTHTKSYKTLIFYVNNDHVYPILDDSLKKSIA